MLSPVIKDDHPKTDKISKTVQLVNNKSTSIINLKDFMKLKSDICCERYDNDKREREDRLRKLSLEKVKKWPDSIEHIKKRELGLRKERFFEEELVRRKADEEEAKYQKIIKQIILDNAKKRFFESQDIVKSFHSSLILSDILKEREYQKEITKKKLEHNRIIDKQWELLGIEKMKVYDENEKRKIEENKLKRLEQIGHVNKQFREFKLKKVREYQDGVVEGNVVQNNAKQAIIEEK